MSLTDVKWNRTRHADLDKYLQSHRNPFVQFFNPVQDEVRGLFALRLAMMLGLRAFYDFDEKKCASCLPKMDLRLGAVKIIIDRVTGTL